MLKKPVLTSIIGGVLGTLIILLAFTFLPMIPPTERYSISVDPIMVKDEMGTETHVEIRNTGIEPLTNVKVDYGTARPDVIPLLPPGAEVTLSPPSDSSLEEVRVTTDQGIDVAKPYGTPASFPFPCAASC